MVWPNVLIALVVTVGGSGFTWLVALLFAKVLKWPSKKTVRRFDRFFRENRGYVDPRIHCWLLGLFLPGFIGLGIDLALAPPTTSRPNYEGTIVEVRECDRGPMTLWWLYRCDVAVRFDAEPVRQAAGLPEAPAHPVALRLDAQRPLQVGDPVRWAVLTDLDGETRTTYALPFERDRPSLLAGAAVGWLLAFVGSVWAGRWWHRSRPAHPADRTSILRLYREVRARKRGGGSVG